MQHVHVRILFDGQDESLTDSTSTVGNPSTVNFGIALLEHT
jgi:hypothetical protein